MGRYIFFDKVIQIGRLYLDYIFYEFESEPILFSCVNDEKKLYLCLCSEIRYGQKWVITECELSTLKALIDEKMDIASAFLLKNEIIIIDMDLQGKESSYVIRSEEIDRLDLPKEGMYIKNGYFRAVTPPARWCENRLCELVHVTFYPMHRLCSYKYYVQTLYL